MVDPMPPSYRFDRFELDVPGRRLRTRDGVIVELSHRAFDVLQYLVEHRGRDVARSEVIAAVWPRTIVEDNNLDQAVSALRKALGDSPALPRFVLTIPGRGYRFIGVVEVTDPTANRDQTPAPPQPESERVGTVSAPRRPSGGRRGAAALAIVFVGVVAAIAWGVAHKPGSTSATPLPGTDAYEFYAAGLYHWQRRGPGSHAEAVQNFERAVSIEPRFAAAWASLSGALAATAVFNTARPSEALPRALAAARRAVDLDPRSAAANAALGHALVLSEHRFAEGEAHYAKAVALDPQLAQARVWRALNLAHLGRLDAAVEEMRIAQGLDPRSLGSSANLGLLLYLRRDYSAARTHLERLLAVEPQSAQTRAYLARVLLAMGDPKAAIELTAGEVLQAPGAAATLGAAFAASGRQQDAERELATLEARSGDGFAAAYDMAAIHVAMGRHEQACADLLRAFADGSPGLGMLGVDPAMDAIRELPCYAAVRQRLYG
jgi:DNA-binding winged helix-turn-helix (wHTH) protein/Tfp pilus assembly protein PilF